MVVSPAVLAHDVSARAGDYHREYSLHGSYSLCESERSDVISVLKSSIEYSFVFLECLMEPVILINS